MCDKWQPIATAPMKQTILLYVPEAKKSHVGPIQTGSGGISATGSIIWIIGGNMGFDVGKPTYWQPLPTEPTTENDLQMDQSDEESHLVSEDDRCMPEPGRLAEKDVAEIVKRHSAEIKDVLRNFAQEQDSLSYSPDAQLCTDNIIAPITDEAILEIKRKIAGMPSELMWPETVGFIASLLARIDVTEIDASQCQFLMNIAQEQRDSSRALLAEATKALHFTAHEAFPMQQWAKASKLCADALAKIERTKQ